MTDLLPPAVDVARLVELAHASHRIITTHQHPDGAYPASPTFSAYRGYAWLRDGSFIAEGVSRYGDVGSASGFHDWTARVLAARAEQVAEVAAASRRGDHVADSRMLPTRFRLDGGDGTDAWWDFQTDGYGTWIWSALTHARRHGLPPGRWQGAIHIATDYLTAVWDRPCYDWWEEHMEHRHVSTLAAIHGGLAAAVSSGVLDDERAEAATCTVTAIREFVLAEGTAAGRAGDPARRHLAKWVGSDAVDASLAACVVPFGLVEPGSSLAQATLDAIVRDLAVDGGVHRFRDDVFYGGGQWLLLAGLLGWNLAVAGDREGAVRHLAWIAQQALPNGELPEQVSDRLLHGEHRDEWLRRWGPVATPLLWSHGMYLILADELDLLDGGFR